MDEEELRKQREEITAIVKMRVAGTASGTQHAGDFICTVYLEEKKAEAEQHIKVGARDLEARGLEESGWAWLRLR